MRKRKRNSVLFIDIDSVLAAQNRPDPLVLDSRCILHLRSVVSGSDAAVVLSSSWPWEDASAVLESHGVSLYGALDDDRVTYDGRPRAIVRWIEENPEFKSWVAIDDDPILETVARFPADDPARRLLVEPWRFIRTRYYQDPLTGQTDGDGLTERLADAASVVLVENREPQMPVPGPVSSQLPCDDCGRPSVYVLDDLPMYDPVYKCAEHAWPRPGIHWRSTRAGEQSDKRRRID